jgi:hypothetical protein
MVHLRNFPLTALAAIKSYAVVCEDGHTLAGIQDKSRDLCERKAGRLRLKDVKGKKASCFAFPSDPGCAASVEINGCVRVFAC